MAKPKGPTMAMVLNDGETYTGVRGSRIVEIPLAIEDLDAWVKEDSPDGTIYEFEGDEVIAFTDEERSALTEAMLYLEEQADGRYKDAWGNLVPKRKRQKVLDSIGEKLRLN